MVKKGYGKKTSKTKKKNANHKYNKHDKNSKTIAETVDYEDVQKTTCMQYKK